MQNASSAAGATERASLWAHGCCCLLAKRHIIITSKRTLRQNDAHTEGGGGSRWGGRRRTQQELRGMKRNASGEWRLPMMERLMLQLPRPCKYQSMCK